MNSAKKGLRGNFCYYTKKKLLPLIENVFSFNGNHFLCYMC